MNFSLNIRGCLKHFDRPAVMGILNLTPDSFHDGSRVLPAELGICVERMIADGARIIDVGCCSTRPGAPVCDEATELQRLRDGMLAIGTLSKDVLWSVDTFRASVAREAIEKYGFDIVNDVSGGADNEMFPLIARLKVPYVLTHPGNHFNSSGEGSEETEITARVMRFFGRRLATLQVMGIADVILDPGFGFGKTLDENYILLKNLDVFENTFRLPLLVGISRKSMITCPLDCTPAEALNGTTVLDTAALMKGASILRVHDVAEASEAIRLVGNLNS